jgi:cytochrome P450
MMPEIEAPYFDEQLEAWVLSRHADVLAAFRSSKLWPGGSRTEKNVEPPDEAANLRMREEAREALSSVQLREWRDRLTPMVKEQVDGLRAGQTVDLLAAYAQPTCLALAVMVTGADAKSAEHLRMLGESVSASAAEPFDEELRCRAAAANAELRGCFHSGPESLRDSGFVALSLTMPSLLGNAWYALLQHPESWRLLHEQPELTEQAIEEMLRYAGIVRILFRRATEDVDVGGAAIRKGDRIVLRIFAANRDPERFSDPGCFDVMRRGLGQLTLGAGPHACVGANLIRMAAVTITRPLVERFAWAKLVDPVEWKGGSGFRMPAALPVRMGVALG